MKMELDFSITKLGKGTHQSPIRGNGFENDESAIAYSSNAEELARQFRESHSIISIQKAGPRRNVFHNPDSASAAILTAGGLCPGINDVIKGIVETLYGTYGVKKIYGIKYGFRGLVPAYGLYPVVLDPAGVDQIHLEGGTILGSSRGPQDVGVMVDTLVAMNINMLFCIGGDGTLRGTNAIAEEVLRRRLPISVVGIPKTIDNDIAFVDKTFGFETAVYQAAGVITAAHNEAKGAYNGVGLVHVMGRDSGFIAVYTALANSNANYCFIPEIKFSLEGENGFLPHLMKRLDRKQHAVIIVAEGAGQEFFAEQSSLKDSSGNKIHNNIGLFLKDRIISYARENGSELAMKYFDPTYLIRGYSAEGTDAVYCILLAQNAVHVAMAGYTDMIVGLYSNEFVHIPIKLATRERKKVDVNGALWRSLLEITGQPDFS